MSEALKDRISEATKAAMRARDKQRLGVLRLVGAEIKRVEVDERIEADDTRILAILEKMQKQRRDSERQYRDAGRSDLAEQEAYEIGVIQDFLPDAMSAAELDAAIQAAIAESGAASMRDMGKVMALLRPRIQGRADMGAASARVKALLV